MKKHEVVIVGGGSAGISVAARLLRSRPELDVAIVEPSGVHDYQPLWTLVGGGAATKKEARREEADLIPEGAVWIRDAVGSFDPERKAVELEEGGELGYEFLIVAPGIRCDWGAIPGLKEGLGKDGVCSNYSYDSVDSTWEFIRATRSGRAIFTHPNTPIKCGGAPQKIMYLACDHWRREGVLKDIEPVFAIATPGIFSVEKYARTLRTVAANYGVDVRYKHDLAELRPQKKEAVLRNLDDGSEVVLGYEMIHVTPPMTAPDCLRGGPLANAGGWCEVDKATLRHVRYPEVFGLGDASSLPTSKTGAAIRKQAPVCAENVLSALAGEPLEARYDGYTSCPLVTGYGKLVLAEFDYDLTPRETFPFDQSKERWSMYQLKRHVLPRLYWHGMLKGRA